MTMQLIFGVLVLVLLVWGLSRRKKEKKEWIKEERYEESGAWIDKRSGERGTYGSLDEEMEANRRYISRQGMVSELALLVQQYCFAQAPRLSEADDAVKRAFFQQCKSESEGLFGQIDRLMKEGHVPVQQISDAPDMETVNLKKQVLAFCYERMPELLGQEIEALKLLDRATEVYCDKLLKAARSGAA